MPSSFFVNNGGSTAARTTITDDLTASAAAKSDAQKLALNAEDAQFTLSDGVTTGNSALHYNAKANASATAAAGSATTASQQAVLANDAKLAAQTAKAEAVALHTDAVQLTGDQTIAGEKTFSATVAVTSGITASGNLLVGQSGGGGNAVIAGSSSPSYTNQAGTNLLLKSGDGSGTGSSFMSFSTSPAGSSGTTVNTAVERLRIASDGQVMIGTTTEGDAEADTLTIAETGNAGMTIRSGSSNSGTIFFSDATTGAGEYAGVIQYNHSGNYMRFSTGGSERLRIDSSGNVLIGKTAESGTQDGFQFKQTGECIVGRGSNDTMFKFQDTNNSGTQVGSITMTASATAYNTSSDYRLKTDAQPMTGATDRLKQLNPVNFQWIADGTRVDGFLAHEAQAIVPESVTGTKDAMKDEEYEVTPAVLDADDNVVTEAVMGTRSVPDYQGIDQAKLVPLLVATIQELEARITALES